MRDGITWALIGVTAACALCAFLLGLLASGAR